MRDELEWFGSVSHHITLPAAQGFIAGVDKGVERLQQTMSKIKKEDAATR
jgi:hypothetical protein